jgi:glycosyltransferase involved in cell wall biosynthesis
MNREVCVVTGIFPPDSGGPAKFALTFCDWLIKNNVPTSVLTLTDENPKIDQVDGYQVVRISRNTKLIVRYLKMILEIRKNSKLGKYIIANGCFVETGLAFLFTKRKYITKVPGDIVWERAVNSGKTGEGIIAFQDLRLPLKYRAFRYLFTLSLKRSTNVIVPSNELADLCIRWGVKKEKITVIHNSVSLEDFFPDGSDKLYDVVSVARLVPWKGLNELIRCAASHSIKLAIVGDGPQKSELFELSKSLNVEVTFFGNKSQSEIPSILNSSRFFVLNSEFEATSYALLEARACGLVAIANAGTGSEEVIKDHYDGLLIRRLTGPSLHQCLEEALSPSFDYDSYSNNAVERTRIHFNKEVNFAKIYSIVLNC